MAKKILNLHRLNTNNVGDLRCAPYLYFDQLVGVEAIEILGFRQADEKLQVKRREYKDKFAAADIIVIGGGGLLEIDFFEPAFQFIKENIDRKRQKTVIWGAGHNSWQIGDWRKLKAKFSFSATDFDLVGVRDFGHDFDWVPCVSCMSPVFDETYATKRAVGLYAHTGTMNNANFRAQLPQGFEILSNAASFKDAIEFIGTSELLLTDSFHGAYWATLMGRKVVAFPSSSKFYDLKHAVPLCAPEDWERFSKLSITYPEAKDECRAANLDFAEKFKALL